LLQSVILFSGRTMRARVTTAKKTSLAIFVVLIN
jgi:hypothetical protein